MVLHLKLCCSSSIQSSQLHLERSEDKEDESGDAGSTWLNRYFHRCIHFGARSAPFQKRTKPNKNENLPVNSESQRNIVIERFFIGQTHLRGFAILTRWFCYLYSSCWGLAANDVLTVLSTTPSRLSLLEIRQNVPDILKSSNNSISFLSP